jgi:hypothetical protein
MLDHWNGQFRANNGNVIDTIIIGLGKSAGKKGKKQRKRKAQFFHTVKTLQFIESYRVAPNATTICSIPSFWEPDGLKIHFQRAKFSPAIGKPMRGSFFL